MFIVNGNRKRMTIKSIPWPIRAAATSYHPLSDEVSLTQQCNAFIFVSINCKYIGVARIPIPDIKKPTINHGLVNNQ